MGRIAVKIENISKRYRLGAIGTGTLSHDLNRLWTVGVMGKEDPYLKIDQTVNNSIKKGGDYIWALKGISLEIRQGDVFGIIGKNGAGKSTLLKILSRVTKPTTGSIRYKGRIASLLEVGTGFHPEMTGRENIYMNGSIMGMTRAEITRKMDEIIDFAGVARFVNTPIKRYSSGMVVRLGFAIAASLDPEILVVDEVLAVGDAEFQEKALGKMQEISTNQGRTVLFVSHNLGSVSQICPQTIVLKDGRIDYLGSSSRAIEHYLSSKKSDSTSIIKEGIPTEENQYLTFKMVDGNHNEKTDFRFDEDLGLIAELYLPEWNPYLELAVSLQDKYQKRIFTIHEKLINYYTGEKKIKFHIGIPAQFITPGNYSWIACINIPGNKRFDLHEDVASFVISETGSPFSRYDGVSYGCVFAKYEINKIL